MSEINIPRDDIGCPFEVIISQESSDHSDAEIYDWTDDSERDPFVNGCGMDSELSASTDNAYTLRYYGDYKEMLLPNEWSDHLLTEQSSGHYLHKENSMLINHRISHRIQLRCSHIIIKHMYSEAPSSWRKREIKITRKEALRKIMKTRRLIRSGKVSFERMARISSDCCSARRNGDLGTFHPGQIWPKFETILMGLKINELSQIFETQAGFHIVLRTQPENQVETLRSKIVIANEKIKARKHMRKEQTELKSNLTIKGCKQSQKFEELYGQKKVYVQSDVDRKPWEISTHKTFLTIEEENDFKKNLYEEQERQIEKTILDHTLTKEISKLIIKDSTDKKASENVPAFKTSHLKDSKNDEDKPFIIKPAKNAIDLLKCCDPSMYAKTHVLIPKHFLVGSIGPSPSITVSGGSRAPSEWELGGNQYEKWRPPNCEREVKCVWKRKSLLTLTSANTDE